MSRPLYMKLRDLALTLRLAPLAGVLTFACQVLFGDYEIDSSQIRAIPCRLGQTRCVGAVRERCVADQPAQHRWQVEETCASAALCNLVLDDCSACEPGAFQCNDGKVERCSSDGKAWLEGERCSEIQFCRVEPTGVAHCLERCPANAYACSGDVLQRCSLDRERWETVEVCKTPALCDAEDARARVRAGKPAHCSVAECLPEQFDCSGGSARICDAGRWGPSAAALANCSAACIPGTFRCAGVTPFRCTASGAWERAGADCAAATLCRSSDGTCEPPACQTPGEFRCSAERLERCKWDQSAWEVLDQCAHANACDAKQGRCRSILCQPDSSVRCNGNELEFCSQSWTNWDPLFEGSCGASDQCDLRARACSPIPCTRGALRCNDRYLETCGDGEWQRTRDCATRELCDEALGMCKPPPCGVPGAPEGEFRCESDGTLKKCNRGRDGFGIVLATCAPGKCDAAIGRCRD